MSDTPRLPVPGGSPSAEERLQKAGADELLNFSWDDTDTSTSSSLPTTPSYGGSDLGGGFGGSFGSSSFGSSGLDSGFSLDSHDYEPEPESGIVLPSMDTDIQDVSNDDDKLDINHLLEIMLEKGASDLHLSAKAYPSIRVDGDMQPIEGYGRLSGAQIRDAMYAILTEEQQNRFDDELELDFSYTLPGKSRFRVNILKQQQEVGAVLRAIPWKILTAEELGLPDVVNSFADLPRGLVLVTGPTGSGKSTTLAAIIDRANRNRPAHIITVEDPVEFVHEHRRSIVNQREVGVDTHSFANALKHALRQDPDIILVGEMRDLETISVALTAAETGHLVFGTLHTQSAQETITRIVDVFPEGDKAHVQAQLGSTIQAVVSQTLLKKIGGGRVAALEIMVATDAIRNQIREGKLQTIQSYLTTGKDDGMQTLDGELKRLVEEGIVTWEEAASKSTNRKEFIASLGGQEGIERLEKRAAARRNSRGGWL